MLFLLLLFVTWSTFAMDTQNDYCDYDYHYQEVIEPIKRLIDNGISKELQFTLNYDPEITLSCDVDRDLLDVTKYGENSVKLYIAGQAHLRGSQLLDRIRESNLSIKHNYPKKYIASIHLAGPFVCFNNPDQNWLTPYIHINSNSSFGGENEGEAIIAMLDILVNRAKIKHIDIWTICKGTMQFFKALEMLTNTQNEYRRSFNKLFTTDQAERKENILRALRSVRDFVPLIDVPNTIKEIAQKPSDSIEYWTNKVPVSGPLLNYYFLKPIVLDNITRGITHLTKNYLFPAFTSYKPTQPNAISMLKKMQHIKGKYDWSFVVTAQANDEVIGNDNERLNEFFQLLPCAEDRKFLLSDEVEGHNNCSRRQIQAINAFDKQEGATYYELGKYSLKDGKRTLKNALKSYHEDPITHICNGYSGVYK